MQKTTESILNQYLNNHSKHVKIITYEDEPKNISSSNDFYFS